MFRSKQTDHNELYPNEVETIKALISTCIKEHKACSPLKPGPFFPTRLLDLRTPTLRLIDGKDLSPLDGGYAALSYCWGTTMPETGKTTSQTIVMHRKEIKFELLPRTLRDVISAARALGIPFIWIDALCIIQGDADDWKKESVTMCQVYSQAIITLAAASSDHCDRGFIQPRISKYQRVRNFLNYIQGDYSLESRFSLGGSPLSKRGWSLQERHLSTRIIHFLSDCIIWECRSRCSYYQVQTRPQPKVLELSEGQIKYALRIFDSVDNRNITTGDITDVWNSREDPHDVWRSMIQDYSIRGFTNPSDKLAAVAGLAEAMQPSLKGDYLFGVWTGDLSNEMRWIRTYGGEHHQENPKSYAPSWSWASTNFQLDWNIVWTERVGEEVASGGLILQVGASSISPESRGFIRLRALMRSLGSSGAPDMRLYFDGPVMQYANPNDAFLKRNIEDIEKGIKAFPTFHSHKIMRDFVICRVSSRVHCTRDQPEVFSFCAELILQRTGLVRDGILEYERVGLATEIPLEWMAEGTLEEIILV